MEARPGSKGIHTSARFVGVRGAVRSANTVFQCVQHDTAGVDDAVVAAGWSGKSPPPSTATSRDPMGPCARCESTAVPFRCSVRRSAASPPRARQSPHPARVPSMRNPAPLRPSAASAQLCRTGRRPRARDRRRPRPQQAKHHLMLAAHASALTRHQLPTRRTPSPLWPVDGMDRLRPPSLPTGASATSFCLIPFMLDLTISASSRRNRCSERSGQRRSPNMGRPHRPGRRPARF